MGRELGCSPAQVALAWLLAQGPDIVPIPGTRHIANLEENFGALDVALGPEHLNPLEGALDPNKVGSRH